MSTNYEILGVSPDATKSEIKKAYRDLSLKYHPDRNRGATEEQLKELSSKFNEVTQAYNNLMGINKQQSYDESSDPAEKARQEKEDAEMHRLLYKFDDDCQVLYQELINKLDAPGHQKILGEMITELVKEHRRNKNAMSRTVEERETYFAEGLEKIRQAGIEYINSKIKVKNPEPAPEPIPDPVPEPVSEPEPEPIPEPKSEGKQNQDPTTEPTKSSETTEEPTDTYDVKSDRTYKHGYRSASNIFERLSNISSAGWRSNFCGTTYHLEKDISNKQHIFRTENKDAQLILKDSNASLTLSRTVKDKGFHYNKMLDAYVETLRDRTSPNHLITSTNKAAIPDIERGLAERLVKNNMSGTINGKSIQNILNPINEENYKERAQAKQDHRSTTEENEGVPLRNKI